MVVGKNDLSPGDVAHVLGFQPKADIGPGLYMVLLDNTQYPLSDISKYQQQGLPSIREGVTTVQSSPDESLFDHTGTWWRRAYDWTHGAGQSIFDLASSADNQMFRSSLGIDTSQKLGISLARADTVMATMTHQALVAASTYCWGSGPYMVWVDGLLAYTRFMSDAAAFGGAQTTATGMGGSTFASDVAVNGKIAYIACKENIAILDVPSCNAFATLGGGATRWYSLVRLVGNRVLAARPSVATQGLPPNVLVEALTGGAETVILQHPSTTFSWIDAAAVGSLIYVCGSTGDVGNPSLGAQSQIYSLTTTSTGTLVLGPQAAPFGVGETIRSMTAHAGLLVIVTSAGIRVAEPAGDGTLTYGPLFANEIVDPPNNVIALSAFSALSNKVGRPDASDGHVWIPVNTMTNQAAGPFFPGVSADETKGWNGILRLDLQTFTAPLVPAYTFDTLMPRTTGFVRIIQKIAAVGLNRSPVALALIYNNSGSSSSPYSCFVGQPAAPNQTPIYETSGYINSGRIYFGTVEQKRLTSLVVRFDALKIGESISAKLVDQDGVTIQGIAVDTTLGSTGMSLDFEGDLCDWCELTLTLNGPGTTTPTLRSWQLRAYPVPQTTEQFMVPLRINTRVITGGGQGEISSYDPLAEVQKIEQIWREKRAVKFSDGGGRTRRVRIDNFQVNSSRWITEGEYLEVDVLVQLLSL